MTYLGNTELCDTFCLEGKNTNDLQFWQCGANINHRGEIINLLRMF